MNKRIRKKKGLSKVTISELWGLDYTLAKYILPRLIKFKENAEGHPSNITWEEYLVVLDKMIWSFNYIIKDDSTIDFAELKKKDNRCQEGLHLFAEYFRSLWI